MDFLPKEPYKKIFCIVFYIILTFAGIYFLFKYAFPVLLPFAISFFIACAVRRPAAYLSSKTGFSKKFVAVFLGLALLLACACAVSVCVSKLIGELSSFARGILENKEDIMATAMGFSQKLDDFLAKIFPGALDGTVEFREKLAELITDAVKNIVSGITTKIPAFVGYVFSAIPKILFFSAATLLSCIYFCLDFDEMSAFIKKHLSRAPFAALTKFKRASLSTVGRYVRANLIIFLITATELTIGFLIIDVKYALLLGVVTAFIDILPVFGSGTVLVPYAVYGFLSGDFRLGIGVAILYGVVTLVRQFCEPKIMGKNLGVHPLISLAAVYAGYSFFGVIGVIFLPITVVIAKNIVFTENT